MYMVVALAHMWWATQINTHNALEYEKCINKASMDSYPSYNISEANSQDEINEFLGMG